MKRQSCLGLLSLMFASRALGADPFAAPPAPSDSFVASSVRYLDGALLRDHGHQADRDRWLGNSRPTPPVPPQADDATFLRRACIDLAGRLPAAEEVRAFLASTAADKRSQATEALLREPGAAEVRFRLLAEAFRVTDQSAGIDWLRKAAADDMPLDEMVKAMMMAEKGTPPARLLEREGDDPFRTACALAETLLGQSLCCAMCHDHPFSTPTQMQCYQFAACFGPQKLPARYLYRDGRPGAKVQPRPLPEPGASYPPGTLEGGPFSRQARAQLAEALAGTSAKRFGLVTALRVWRGLFGTPGAHAHESSGAVEVLPAWSEQLPPHFERSGTSCFAQPLASQPWTDNSFDGNNSCESVRALEEVFQHCHYRMGDLQRILARTEAYGRECMEVENSPSAAWLPAAPQVRRLPAEVIWDALVSRLPPGQSPWRVSALSAQVPEASHPLRLLGRGRREWPDESTRAVSFDLARFMMNGPVVDQAAQASGGLPAHVNLDDLVLSILGRPPTENERAAARRHLGESPVNGAGDLAWALLNTREFMFER